MRISNSEGVVLVNYLVSQKIDLSHVKKKCQATIQEFRLDKDIFVKAGTRLRRHYTCPFFTDHQLGCSIPPEFKPLGCLAFNPTEPLGKGQTCKSIAYPEFKDGEKLEIPLMILKALENILRVF
ncbi:MAG: hypothetical protein A2X86_20460 [Bdellovibrionales bacterium GWA2_49_15]|nr:MAG: hypothetical protein A2X86_20460 [Bdellovibrionales bacterium GWA2_49_15]HAZ11312.1 hypothetical protein [Bdellovibrionales bacterium]